MKETDFIESKTLRDEMCQDEYLDILERVGQLITIPGTAYTTKENAAKFYEVSVGTIDSATSRHRDELVADGYKMLSAKEFCTLHDARIKSKARFLSLYPRRAMLRLGMILRDSRIAKMVRSYLLAVEENVSSVRSDKLSQMADQIVSQALILKAIVSEINMTKDDVKKLKKKYDDHDSRIAALETLQDKELLVTEHLSLEQIDELRKMVKKIDAKSISVWRRFNKYFGITRYKFLPVNRFHEAVDWLNAYDK